MPLIDRAVGIDRPSLSADLAVHPVAFVAIARGQAVAAAPVLAAVAERALIDAAVVILLGDDRRLRLGRRGAVE